MHNNLSFILSNVNKGWALKLSLNIKEVLGICYTKLTSIDISFLNFLYKVIIINAQVNIK